MPHAGRVAQAHKPRHFGRRAVRQYHPLANLYACEQLSGLFLSEHRRFAALDDMFLASHCMRRINGEDLADHEPVERSQAAASRPARMLLLQVFHPGRYVERPNGCQRQPAIFAPGEKPTARPRIGPPRVIVVLLVTCCAAQRWFPKGCLLKLGLRS
jgi:hypothetical protein